MGSVEDIGESSPLEAGNPALSLQEIQLCHSKGQLTGMGYI